MVVTIVQVYSRLGCVLEIGVPNNHYKPSCVASRLRRYNVTDRDIELAYGISELNGKGSANSTTKSRQRF